MSWITTNNTKMPAFMPIHDLSQLNDMASIPLPIIIKVKGGYNSFII